MGLPLKIIRKLQLVQNAVLQKVRHRRKLVTSTICVTMLSHVPHEGPPEPSGGPSCSTYDNIVTQIALVTNFLLCRIQSFWSLPLKPFIACVPTHISEIDLLQIPLNKEFWVEDGCGGRSKRRAFLLWLLPYAIFSHWRWGPSPLSWPSKEPENLALLPGLGPQQRHVVLGVDDRVGKIPTPRLPTVLVFSFLILFPYF